MIIGIVFGGKGVEKQCGLEACQDIEYVLDRFYIKSKRICLNRKEDLIDENLKRVDLFLIVDSNCDDYSRRDILFNFISKNQSEFIGQKDKTFKLARNKFISNRMFRQNGIRTPKSILIDSTETLKKNKQPFGNKFPLIVKDNFGSSSENIEICFEERDFIKKTELLLKKCSQVIVEEFIKGIEITSPFARLFGSGFAFNPIEIKYKGLIYDFETKNEIDGNCIEISSNLNKHLSKKIQKITIEANCVIESDFCTRVDFRMKGEVPYVLEINGEPALPKYDFLANCARLSGISYNELIIGLLANSSRFVTDAEKNNLKLYRFINKAKKKPPFSIEKGRH